MRDCRLDPRPVGTEVLTWWSWTMRLHGTAGSEASSRLEAGYVGESLILQRLLAVGAIWWPEAGQMPISRAYSLGRADGLVDVVVVLPGCDGS